MAGDIIGCCIMAGDIIGCCENIHGCICRGDSNCCDNFFGRFRLIFFCFFGIIGLVEEPGSGGGGSIVACLTAVM
jgi:hypothetical protein